MREAGLRLESRAMPITLVEEGVGPADQVNNSSKSCEPTGLIR